MLKKRILHILDQKKGNLVTGGQLARDLEVSRTAIWKAIHALQEEGNEIISVPNCGYKLMVYNDTLLEKRIQEQLTTSVIGQEMKIISKVDSTNQYLKEMDETNVNNGFVVFADEQQTGRGRRGRPFVSVKGEGLYFSILLKLDREKQDLRLLTICAAVATAKAIESVCKIDAEIKWVNDIFHKGKKLCGILTEAVISGELQEISTLIVGIGINTGKVASEISDIATSIQEASGGTRGIRNQLAAEILNQFEKVYLDYTERGRAQEILQDYKERLFIIGKDVLVENFGNEYVAKVLGIDGDGALMVRDREGNTQRLSTGSIRLHWGEKG